jgi:hypothetical protein
LQFTGLFSLQTVLIGAGVAALLVTLLYVLKLRKRRVEVPFSGLWAKVVEEQSRQSSLWRQLRRILSWLLQILLVALLAFGILDPQFEEEVVSGRHIVLLLDNSASMAATDVAGGANRLDVGRSKALELLETVGAEDRIMFVTFNSQVHPRSPFVSEPPVLEQMLRDVEVTGTGTSFEEALSFAADSLRDRERGELVIVSDGAGFERDRLKELELGESTTVRHVQVGEGGGNLAVTGFNVRRYVANKFDYELFVQVRNYFERTVQAELQIYADGRMVDSKSLTLEAGETQQRFYPSQAVAGERLEARIELKSRDARDVFPLDDRAFALLPKMEKVDVQMVTSDNLYLEGALLLNPNVDVQQVAPEDYTPEGSADVDVTIFDRVTPKIPESGNFAYIAPEGEDSPWQVTGTDDNPTVTSVKRSHPLMRWITLKDLNIGSARKLKMERGDVRVASSFGTPLIVARAGDRRNLVALSFDVRDSDLPLRVAFPMLLFNLVDYFELDDASYIPNYVTGETWAIEMPEGVEEARVTNPRGETSRVPVFEGRAVFRGLHPGFYEIRTDRGTTPVAANLSDLRESDVSPGSIDVGEASQQKSADALFFDRRELWIWAVLAVFVLLIAEWWTYNRKITV